ncbi:uncharacterized protein RAG0_06289 [Rhynchosporium agropyri]|uniref:Uncharacterized protein n=1 Tax=Rhynchosporium agropyri TaxID=914238 RepID=A0A1E1KGQ1_9HELO|nr:uncharacterized protein RAG0_06289 [Rhynchosporium agropyri]
MSYLAAIDEMGLAGFIRSILYPTAVSIEPGFHSTFIELFPPQAIFDIQVPSTTDLAGAIRDPTMLRLSRIELMQTNIANGQNLEQIRAFLDGSDRITERYIRRGLKKRSNRVLAEEAHAAYAEDQGKARDRV